MKKILEFFYVLLFVIGILFIGVGIMAIFLDADYVEKYNDLSQTREPLQVEIVDKGVYFSGGGSTSSNRHEFFDIAYLGEPGEREFSRIDPVLKEFEAYEKGDMVSVFFDPEDPYEAFIVKTPEQLKEIDQKPFFIIAYGIIMIMASWGLSKLFKKLYS